jgi:acetyl-CoA C-acetyltransferase
MREVVAINALRTPVGSFGGILKSFNSVQMGSLVIKEVLEGKGLRPRFTGSSINSLNNKSLKEQESLFERSRTYWDMDFREIEIDEVILGNVLQAGQGQNISRQAALFSGIPVETPAYTVNKVCGSGLKAIILGALEIISGGAETIIAGGTESMSNAPYALPGARWGYRMDLTARGELLDLMVMDGLWEKFYNYHIGETAENIAQLYHISREEQDEIAFQSWERGFLSKSNSVFKDEIIPVNVPQRKAADLSIDKDERPRKTSREYLAGLKPVFNSNGSVTSGNSSGINDGAAVLLLMSKDKAIEKGLKPIAKLVAWAASGIDPRSMGLAPVTAIKKVMDKTGLKYSDLGIIEINEAFASQLIACMKELEWSYDRVNLNGSGISLGHPIGCTGARLAVSLIHSLQRTDMKYGLQALCIGGGMGLAAIWENIE